MIEVLVFVEPFDGEVVLVCQFKGLVLGSEVLEAALGRYKLVSSVIGWLVSEAQAERQPALLDLGVRVSCHAEVRIDEG